MKELGNSEILKCILCQQWKEWQVFCLEKKMTGEIF